MNSERLIVVGAGGHGKVVADIASHCGYKDIVFLDSNEDLIGKTVGYRAHKVCGTPMDVDQLDGDVFVAIGESTIRAQLIDFFSIDKNRNVISLIHPKAIVSDGVIIEDGVVVMPGAVINTGTIIKRGSIINTCSSVDHDCVIGKECHIAPGANICGNVLIGNNCWIGAGATVINNISILDGVTIGAGAVVVSTIERAGKYIGVPAKKVL